MSGVRLARLDADVVRLSPGAAAFLKVYSTNLPDRPRNAFVDLKGKIVAVFNQWTAPGGDEALLVFPKSAVRRAEAHLAKFLDVTGTGFEETPYSAYWDLDGTYEADKDERAIQETAGRVILTPLTPPSSVPEEEFRLFRLRNRLPLQGIDYDDEMILNVYNEEVISYTKGCYLGQEIVARVHYRSKPPRALAVRAEDECSPAERAAMTSKTADPETGRTLGFVFVAP